MDLMLNTDSHILSLIIVGIAALGMSWMPAVAKTTKISYSIAYVLLGVLVFSLVDGLPLPDPTKHNSFVLHFTELAVIISLMGTGLKIDEPFSFKAWKIPFRLVSVTMILCIAGVAAIAHYFLGFDPASAVLLGAILAPTDPVLASDVQVGPPLEDPKDPARFSLSAEAGMNDGTAFPFTWLAILMAIAAGGIGMSDLGLWFLRDVVYRMVAAIACGYAMGRLLAYVIFYLPENSRFIYIRDGFVGVATTLLIYGLTELVRGYGFIAVFVTALTLRNYEFGHKYHRKLHDFTDQIERIMVAIVLLLFGGSIVRGGVLQHLTWDLAFVGLAFVFLVRPLAGLLSLAGIRLPVREKLVIAFFGIRGVGSFFYLAFALSQTDFAFKNELWSLLSFIVLLSLLVHGITATQAMEKLDEKRE
ncbi:MAG TPA: cation:proton antiporter [Flavisolibacter sp.]